MIPISARPVDRRDYFKRMPQVTRIKRLMMKIEKRISLKGKTLHTDLDDLEKVLKTVLDNPQSFMKELKHLNFKWDKYPHSKHVGLH